MAGNKTLELSIKIAGKVDKSLINAINAAQSNVSSLSTTLSKVGTVGLAAMGTLATGTVAALAKCTDAAKDFESQMGDVVKYVEGLADADGLISDKLASNGATYAQNYATMSKAILDLSTEIPYTAEELTRLAAAAGQSGKAMDDIVKLDANGNVSGFLKDVAMMGTAWDISADQAGDWAAKWEVAFGKNHEEIMELADQINYLGAHNATTAAEIAQVVNEAAGLGQVAGMDVDATAALGTAMLAMGVDTAKAANSINRMYTNMSKGASATKAQKEMWQELGFTATGIAKSMQNDASGTMLKVFGAIQNLPEERQVAALSTLFGQWAITGAAKLTGNLDTFKQALSDIDNNSLFDGSMNREFIIKSETSEALETRMKSALNAFQVDIGTAFLPAKKDISLAIIGFLDTIRNNEDLPRVAEMLASMFGTGLKKAGEALENAMPAIEKVLGYLADNGPEVISILGKMAAAFAAMKFAPGIESLLRGAGGLVFGSKTGGSTHTGSGGIVGLMGNLFRGGQNAASTVLPKVGSAVSGAMGNVGRIAGGAGSLALGGLKGIGNILANPASLLHPASLLGGIRGALPSLGNIAGGLSGLVSPITSRLGELGGTAIGAMGPIGGVVSGVGSMALGGLKGAGNALLNPASLLNPANLFGGIKNAAFSLGSIWGPMASGFGGLLSGALPIVGVISGIIAVVSILGDHLDDIRGIIQNVFGDAGVAVFDSFIGVLGNVGDFITGLFADGGVAAAMAPLRDAITGIFGDDAGAAFDGLVQILQSVMGVVGQVVTFANTTVKPIIEQIFGFITQTVVPIILQTFTAAAPIISGIISNLGSAVMTVAQIIGTAIQAVLPIVEKIISVLMTMGSVVVPALLAWYETFSAGLLTIIQGIQTTFQGIIDFITGIFTGNWQQAWQGVQDIFKGIFEALGGLIKTPINAVISLINKAISGINGLGLTIPDWVPVIGGKSFSINIPEIPMLAKGGFTNGPSIAGEAGMEAVISFQRSARASNIATWAKAGQMLGVSNQPARLETFDRSDGGPGWPDSNGGGPVTITYAPTIIIQGNASREDVDAALREDKARFDAWYEEKKRNERRARW